MEGARSVVLGGNRLAEDDSLTTTAGTGTNDLETGKISTIKFMKPNSGLSTAANRAVVDDYDGGGGESKPESDGLTVPFRVAISNGNHQIQAAGVPETTAANNTAAKTSTDACSSSSSSSNINSLLLRRRRLKRNFSAAATTSATSSAASSGGKMRTAASSSSLGTRSLDRKVLLRQRQMMQLQPSDREWVRADLQRGCIHVHDRAMPPYLRPVLCTLETTAGEMAHRLSQLGSKGGSVVRVVGKGGPATDFNGNCSGRYSFGDAHNMVNENGGSQGLDSLKSTECGDELPTQPGDSVRLLMLPNDNQRLQQQDIHGCADDSVLDGLTASGKTSGIIVRLNHEANSLGDEDPDSRHNGADSCGLNSGSDIDSSTFDDLSSGHQLSGHRDSLSDGMTLGADASILSPTVDSATEGLDPFGSSSDELELDCTSSSLVIDSIARQLERHSADGTSTASNNNAVNSRLCGGQLLNCVEDEADGRGSSSSSSHERINAGKLLPCSRGSNSLSRPLTGNAAIKHDPANPGPSQTGRVSDRGHFTPTLYVQMHGEAARRLGQDEKPLQIQNDYLYKLGFKDPWRVQDEGMDTEIGCLIRFFAGKPHCIEGSERVQLSGTYNVRKGKMQLPVNRWTRRQVILCGTCLIVSSVKDSQTGKMHVLPLIGGKVEEVKKHSHCLAFSSSGPQSHTYYISFDSFTEHLRWQRQAAKMVSQRISSVDLSCCSLEQLPPNLFYSQDLTHLNLKQNFLSPNRGLSELQRFSKLRSLNLSNNHLGEFPEAVCDIPTLTEVNLSCNYLTSVHSAVGAMHNLQTFLLDGNGLQTLPPELGDLLQLGYLGLSFNQFSELPPVLHRLVAMERLCMAGNNLSCLNLQQLSHVRVKQVDLRLNKICSVVPEEAELLCHVTHLDLRDNQLQELDASLFPRLEVLRCERNRLTSLSAGGGLLKGLYASSNELCQFEVYPVPGNLTYMDVSRNRLESLPDWVCESKRLEVLDISHNHICELPIGLFCSSSLRKLLLGHNQLRRLPERLERMQIEVLDVQHNQLLELPSNLFLKADSLRCLNASANKLESLPPSSLSEESQSILQELYLTNNCLTEKCVPLLTGHTHLRVLHLAYNHLQTFPASKMAKLEELEEVDLSGNQLKAIPTTILSCRRMHTLVAHSNCIQVFPEVMQLMDMKCVDLSCNELSEVTLPENLPPKLQELDLTGNPRLSLDHKTLELLNNIRCFRIDQSPASFSVSEGPGAPAVWSHGYTEASGVKNKLCVAALSVNNFCGSREALYGVFDGDRNVEVPYLLQCTMSDVLAEELHKTKSEEDYMTNTFLVMQRKLGTAGQKLGGSAALCHIKHDPMDPGGCFTLTAANVGKCQAILCRDGKPLPLSVVHNVGVAEEYQRIRQHKAIVTEDNKVNGVTDSTRIMGYSFLYPSVIPRPHVQTVTLTPQDEFFILGSRGLWDSVAPGEAVEAVRNVPDALAAAKKLCTLAQGYGCNDSLSAVVVQLSVSEDCCCCCDLGAAPPPSPGLFAPSISVVIRDRPAQQADALPMPSSCSEISSEVSASEMSSEVGSTASDEPPPPLPGGPLHEHHPGGGAGGGAFPPSEPPRSCALHAVCLAGSFRRQLSGAFSDNGLDSEDEEPIAGVFSNGSRVEVEVDIHCLRARERALACQPPPPPPTPEAPENGAELSAGEADGGWAGGGLPPQGRGVGGGDCGRNTATLGRRRGNGSVAPPEKSHNLIEVAADAPTKKQGGYFAAPAQPDPDDQFIIPPELEEEVKELMKQHQQQQQRAPPTEQPAENSVDRILSTGESDTERIGPYFYTVYDWSLGPECVKACRSQRGAWMSGDIFSDWFLKHFVPLVEEYLRRKTLPLRAILLVDNTPAHHAAENLVSETEDGYIQCIFLPANVISSIQPMHQGVLENLKRRYKRELLRRLWMRSESFESYSDFCNLLTVKDALHMCAKVWEEVSSVSLKRSWNILLPGDSQVEEENIEEVDDVSFTEERRQLAISAEEQEEWLVADKNEGGHRIFTDQEIIQQACETEADSDVEEEAERIPHAVAEVCLITGLKWLQQQSEASPQHLHMLRELHALAARKREMNFSAPIASSAVHADRNVWKSSLPELSQRSIAQKEEELALDTKSAAPELAHIQDLLKVEGLDGTELALGTCLRPDQIGAVTVSEEHVKAEQDGRSADFDGVESEMNFSAPITSSAVHADRNLWKSSLPELSQRSIAQKEEELALDTKSAAPELAHIQDLLKVEGLDGTELALGTCLRPDQIGAETVSEEHVKAEQDGRSADFDGVESISDKLKCEPTEISIGDHTSTDGCSLG
ncbi:hypothetical protein SKAU_G00074270 [Synaphobranchus kaupii]|uniref:protein-serine/threonine phosphatase n=1 Tax=Synaphobranchus kaupii TaxID=118154 RepID=A0A9Q1JC15_SYNKA|nr:hypothetical protein SKAU_G00074270 [Synaphobranchus kaupii]